jgi:hypothetical protein
MRFRHLIAAVVLLLAVVPSLWLLIQNPDFPHFGVFTDDSTYFLNAQSLAAGDGYRMLSQPDTPPQTRYPPLFPLLLTVVWKLQPQFPANLPLALKLVWLLIPIFLCLCWRVMRDLQFGEVEAALLCLWLGVSPLFNFMSLSLLSELFLSVLVVATVLLAERAVEADSARLAVFAGLFAASCCLTKSAALPILVSIPLGFALARRKRLVIPFIAASFPAAVVWHLWVMTHRTPSSEDYISNYLTYLRQMNLPYAVWLNLDHVLTGTASFLFFIFPDQLWTEMLSWFVCIAGIAGAVRLLRRSRKKQFALFAVAYLALMISWNVPVGPRMAFPILPLAVAGIWSEAKHFIALATLSLKKRSLSDRAAAVVMLSLLAAFVLFSGTRIYGGLTGYLPGVMSSQRAWLRAIQPVYDWIRGNTQSDARFYANNDILLYFRTGRRGFSVPIPPPLRYATDPAQKSSYLRNLPQEIRKNGATHALILLGDISPDLGDNGREVALAAIAHDPGFRPIFRHPEAIVYEVLPAPASAQGHFQPPPQFP